MALELIKLLIVDDHPIVRKGLRDLMELTADIQVVGEAANGDEAIEIARAVRPEVVLLDLVMPGLGGIEIIKILKADHPNIRILVLTSYSEDAMIISAVRAGAIGYLLKDSSPQDVVRAVHEVYHGESFLHPAIARKLIQEINQPGQAEVEPGILTNRETEILCLVAGGMTNQEIADRLVIARKTVITHVSNMLTKLHLENRTQLALYAVEKGLVSRKQP